MLFHRLFLRSNYKSGTTIFTAVLLSANLVVCVLFAYTPMTGKNGQTSGAFGDCLALPHVIPSDSIPFAKVVIYRPDSQLTRKYNLSTNDNGSFEMARKEVRTINAYSNTLEISVSAFGHKRKNFSFPLSKDKVHYLRVQDRNNYSGFRAYLEVIEVTEDMFRREKL